MSSETAPSQIKSSLLLTGDELDPAEFTKRAGVAPDETWRRGDRLIGGRTTEYGGWSVNTALEESLDLNSQVRKLMRRLAPHEAAIRAAAENLALDVELSCLVEIVDVKPALHLDRDVVEWLGRLGAELDIDMYLFGLAGHRDTAPSVRD